MKIRGTATLLLSLLLLTACNAKPTVQAAQQVAQPQEQARPTSDPYAGDLSIFEYPDRDKKLQINRVMDLLGLHPGTNVADIGAASGWFSTRAARRIAPGGVVYAEDINPKYLDYINKRIVKESLTNVRTLLGDPADPKLPKDSVDVVMLMKVYHEIAQPVAFMQALHSSLRTGARIGIIDRNGSGTDHGLNALIVIKEMDEAGYKLSSQYDFTKADGQDYFLIFAVK